MHIFNIVRFFEAKEITIKILNLQLIRQFIYHYPLKVNPLINPLARNANFGWYNTFRKHVTMSTSSSSANLVLIGDFIIANF